MAEPVSKQSFIAVENALKAIIKQDPITALAGMFTAPTDDSQTLFAEEKYAAGGTVGRGGRAVEGQYL